MCCTSPVVSALLLRECFDNGKWGLIPMCVPHACDNPGTEKKQAPAKTSWDIVLTVQGCEFAALSFQPEALDQLAQACAPNPNSSLLGPAQCGNLKPGFVISGGAEGTTTCSAPRILVHAEEGGACKLTEEFVGLGQERQEGPCAPYFNTSVMEVILARRARVRLEHFVGS